VNELISACVEENREQIIQFRRDFHKYPEVGWTEFRTASKINESLSQLGFTIKKGPEVVRSASRLYTPPFSVLEKAKINALKLGANAEFIEQLEDGLTGVVGIWETGLPGPTIAFRFDIDALQIQEGENTDHYPVLNDFASQHKGIMHACGHDGHTAIGLGLAILIPRIQHLLTGRIKLIFQPAEEGAGGAKAMVDKGILDDVDYFLGGHLGLMATQQNQIICGVTRFYASLKFDIEFKGISAHAALAPHEGRNALLAAATAVLQLHAISRHGKGESRINVGMLKSGGARNTIASHAILKMEIRGFSDEVLAYMEEESRSIIYSVAQMYKVEVSMIKVGETITANCDQELMDIVEDITKSMEQVSDVVSSMPFNASEDVTYMMDTVQKHGGKATYLLFGTELKSGHHSSQFDINEESLPLAVKVFGNVLMRLSGRVEKEEGSDH
jgi:aminobenzoyl-glutamate utilization protein A